MSEKDDALGLASVARIAPQRLSASAVEKELRRLHKENERLREVLEKVLAADDDPNDKLTYIRSRLLAEIKAALRQENKR